MGKKVGILTGGGDAPGLNAVIRAAVIRLAKENQGYEPIGVLDGWAGMRDNKARPLTATEVEPILHEGGTILGSSRTNLYKDKTGGDIQKAIATYKALGLDALIAIGGDDTLEIGYYLNRDYGLNVVGVPKTIDNDVLGTDFTFGFWSSVEKATQAIDDLRVTTISHHRVMVVECMGRHAGWITAYTGLASEADFIAVPEKAVHIDEIAAAVKRKKAGGKKHCIVVVAEGASISGIESRPRVVKDADGKWTLSTKEEKDNFGNTILKAGEVGELVAAAIEKQTGHETRAMALGHLQRGGATCAYDRVLGTSYGLMAGQAVIDGKFGHVVVVRNGETSLIPMKGMVRELQTEAKKYKHLPASFLKQAEVFYG